MDVTVAKTPESARRVLPPARCFGLEKIRVDVTAAKTPDDGQPSEGPPRSGEGGTDAPGEQRRHKERSIEAKVDGVDLPGEGGSRRRASS